MAQKELILENKESEKIYLDEVKDTDIIIVKKDGKNHGVICRDGGNEWLLQIIKGDYCGLEKLNDLFEVNKDDLKDCKFIVER